MEIRELIQDAYSVFSKFQRPEHFTDYTHCWECAEHDETMLVCDLRNIGAAQVGTACWSPIPFLTNEALNYVMPRLLELAITGAKNKDGCAFIFQYLLLLTPKEDYRGFRFYSSEQREVILQSLLYIKWFMWAEVESGCYEEDLELAISDWQRIANGELVKK